MPSQIAHILIGESALSKSSPDAARVYLGRGLAPFFNLGCQGPDVFYHSQRTRPVALHYGVLAHRRGYGRILEGLAESWVRSDGNPESPWAAYILGFATHGALDRAAHPYIVHFSGWVDPSRPETARYRFCHAFLERILDTLLWEREKKNSVSAFDSDLFLSPSGPFPAEFPERLAGALAHAYPSETKEDPHLPSRMVNAFADSFRFFSLTNPARPLPVLDSHYPRFLERLGGRDGPRIVSVLYPKAFPRSVDWGNSSGSSWKHPCRESPLENGSFFDLCEAAVRQSTGILEVLLECFRTRKASPWLSAAAGNGTLNVGDSEGRPGRPRFGNPLPLAEALAEELRARLEAARGLSH